jgi:hypothetical protein
MTILMIFLYVYIFNFLFLQFVVLKFLPINENSDIYIDVGLRKWIYTDLDNDMCGKTYWPPDSKSVTQFVKTEESFKTDWLKYDVEVKRFFSKILFSFLMDRIG